jgi:GGDEF domain-containing protein
MKVEISYGASTTKELRKGEMEKELIQRADSRLYAAKHARGLPYQLSKEA